MEQYLKFYIDGEWVEPTGSARLPVIDPSTEQAFAEIAMGETADVEKAIAAARRAFATFSATSLTERMELLQRVLDILKRRNDEIGDAFARNGCPARHGPRRTGRYRRHSFRADAPRHAGFLLRIHAGHDAHRPRAYRRGGHDHAMELADQPDRLQGCAGAGNRLHDGAEAFRNRAGQRHPVCRGSA